jgi:hypothetical protein
MSSRIKEDKDVKKLLTTVSVAALALAAPAVSAAKVHPSKADQKQAKHFCQELRKSSGKQNFREMFGTGKNHVNAMRNCKRSQSTKIAKQDAKAADQSKKSAAKDCKAERAQDPAAFKAKYGTGKNGKDANGKCVSQNKKQYRQEAKAEQKQDQQDKTNAAKDCKTERSSDAQAFQDKYGTNGNKRNAFGKCVSQKAKAQEQKDEQDGTDQDPDQTDTSGGDTTQS